MSRLFELVATRRNKVKVEATGNYETVSKLLDQLLHVQKYRRDRDPWTYYIQQKNASEEAA